MAVHIAARITALATSQDILVSSMHKNRSSGPASSSQSEAGKYYLKGVPGPGRYSRQRSIRHSVPPGLGRYMGTSDRSVSGGSGGGTHDRAVGSSAAGTPLTLVRWRDRVGSVLPDERSEEMVQPDSQGRPIYSLGHADRELERLSIQGRLAQPITRRLFVEAGIGPGMRVLDVGSGVGDVAFIVSDLVGPAGEVVGTDRVETPLSMARKRAKDLGLENVTFLVGDPTEIILDQPFDAVVGRYVLMYQADPPAWLRDVSANLRPGGVVAFHEPYRDGLRSFPPVPSYDRAWQLVDDTLRATGADPSLGIRLHAVFTAAGLPSPSMRMETLIGGGDHGEDRLRYEIDIVGVLLPEAQRLGIATADEANAETLLERARAEMTISGSVILCRCEVGAWTRRP